MLSNGCGRCCKFPHKHCFHGIPHVVISFIFIFIYLSVSLETFSLACLLFGSMLVNLQILRDY